MLRTTVRIGIVGLGRIAQRAHLPNFASARGARLAAVSSSRKTALRAARDAYGAARCFGDWRDLVVCDAVDAVVVCTPNDSHAAITLAALGAGKHVLVEKPIATGLADARRMVREAYERGRVLAVHHHLRFLPAARAVRGLIEKGALGDVIAIEGCFAHRGPTAQAPRARWFYDVARVGGGVLLDLGVHAFDLLRYWLSDEIERIAVQAVGAADARGGSGEHHASCVVGLRRGAVGNLTVSWRDHAFRNRWYLIGSRATLDVDLAGEGRVVMRSTRGRDERRIRLPSQGGRTAQQDFVDALRSDAASAGTGIASSGRDGTASLAAALAGLRSLEKHRVVDVSLKPFRP